MIASTAVVVPGAVAVGDVAAAGRQTAWAVGVADVTFAAPAADAAAVAVVADAAAAVATVAAGQSATIDGSKDGSTHYALYH